MDFALSAFSAVADRVYVAVAQPAGVNIGLVVGTTGALLVDTGSSPAQGAEIRRAAAAIAGEVPLTHVVVTHAHYDHCYGLAAFDGLVTLAHRDLVTLLESAPPSAEELARFGMTDADLARPTRTFGLAAALDLGDCHPELLHFGRGHTDHDVTIVVPERGVAFFGDLLESAAPPVCEADSWPAEWPKTLDGTLGALRRGFVVVPGHGEPMDREAAFMQRAELHWYHDKAVEIYDAGQNAAGAWREDWPWPKDPSEAFVAQAIARLEASGRPRKRKRSLTLHVR
ncbi:MAG: MBL fold metallo-hydrolase [Propioniciclava sp.]|uniref:MBL fold metallo-hydrolase n=1 Tax=Propioniciclava sp. TaxID=2038686 RepID=UPI0039E2A89D